MTDCTFRPNAHHPRAAASRIRRASSAGCPRFLPCALILAAACVLVPAASSLAAQAPALTTVAPFDRPHLAEIPVITQPVKPGKPLTITGARGAILGEQSGVVELWQLPVKVFSNLHLRADIDGYTVPLELNPAAATVEVRPGHTILTYSLAGITVRQHMLVSPARNGAETTTGAPSSTRHTTASNQPETQSAFKVGPNHHETKTAAYSGSNPHEPTLEDPGALLYFEIDSIRPTTLTVTLTPAMQQMWPAPQYGIPGSGWQPMGEGGAYTIATDNPALFGMVGMPNSKPGHLPVYQEHPQTLPLEFLVRYDPAKDKGRLYPLLSTVSQPGETNNAASQLAMQHRLADQATNLPALAEAIDDYYAHFFDTRLTVHTPDPKFDEALRWAELSIEDSQVEHDSTAGNLTGPAGNQKSETGLVAGWFPSYDSTRPGFGWFFGRDTLWSLYAIDSYGDTALSKRALEFLLHRQRADGKMMHEFSQMADDLPSNMAWSTFGYEYAAADATPLFLLALRDYLRTSGDTQFLADHWEQAKRAYQFERTHDTDGDGVYDNSQGTGWVENWQSPMPHQELYLASLDQQATQAMADLATLQHDEPLATAARATAAKLTEAVEHYRDPQTNLYAFSKKPDGTYDRTLTVYPAVALWNPPTANASIPSESNPGAPSSPRRTKAANHPEPQSAVKVGSGPATNQSAACPDFRTWVQPTPQTQPCTHGLQHPEAMLAAWSSPLMATDWGTRALSTTVPFYDPISYHMGSVWPLFTGWNAMAQYRTNHPAAAWLTLQQNLRLTFAEDPGTVTEVLSGAFYQPLGRSSAHQLWSSAMTLAPAVRGLFGIDVDATANTLSVHPQLPVTWNHAELDNVVLGTCTYSIHILRKGRTLDITTSSMEHPANPEINVLNMPCTTAEKRRTLPLPAVEFTLHDPAAPQPGDETHLPHLTAEQHFPNRTEFDLEAEANTTVLLDVRRNGILDPTPTAITLPAGPGYGTRHITLTANR